MDRLRIDDEIDCETAERVENRVYQIISADVQAAYDRHRVRQTIGADVQAVIDRHRAKQARKEARA